MKHKKSNPLIYNVRVYARNIIYSRERVEINPIILFSISKLIGKFFANLKIIFNHLRIVVRRISRSKKIMAMVGEVS